MEANHLPAMNDPRRRGLALLLGRRRDDDLLLFRLAQRLATAAPRRRGQAA